MPSPMRTDHGESTPDAITWLNLYRRRPPGVHVADGATVILGPYGEPQPDGLMRIEPERGGRCRVNEDGYLTGPPELVVEVSRSSRRFDLGARRADYERAGVEEYWIVDPERLRAEFYRLREGAYEPVLPDEEGRVYSSTLPGFFLRVEWLWRRPKLKEVLKELGVI